MKYASFVLFDTSFSNDDVRKNVDNAIGEVRIDCVPIFVGIESWLQSKTWLCF